jgi:hypothetical protein
VSAVHWHAEKLTATYVRDETTTGALFQLPLLIDWLN